MKCAYIALGTNIEPRQTYLMDALEALGAQAEIKVGKQSAIYETAPVGYLEQSHFLNMVIAVETSLTPLDLLDYCQEIEQRLGRERSILNGPRTIDLDILLYEEAEINTARLTLPHPRMHERAFVLIPLNEIAPELVLPGHERSVADLEKKLPEKERQDVWIWSGK